MSKIYAIASIVNKLDGDIVGLRICDVEEKSIKANLKKYMDIPINNIVGAIQNGSIIVNVELIDGNIVGSNGSLKRLTQVQLSNRNILTCKSYVIINELGELGYTTIDATGKLEKLKKEDIIRSVEEIERNNPDRSALANGKLVTKDNSQFISAISGSFDRVALTKSKVGGNIGLTNGITISTDRNMNSIKNNTRNDVKDTINEKDVFKDMTEYQKKVIQDYYVWYTVELYKTMVESIRFDVNPSKLEQLAQIKGDRNWRFGGIVDTGFLGAGTCELGHSLRYMYYALLIDEKTGLTEDEIVFGETCSADFFNISKEDMKKLVKVRMQMSEEIDRISIMASNNTLQQGWEEVKLLLESVKSLEKLGNLKTVYKGIEKILLSFIDANIPFPQSLVKLARKLAYRNEGIEKGTGKEFYLNMYPEYREEIELIYTKSTSLLEYMYRAIEFIVYNRLDGVYAYDPVREVCRQEGGFNAETRKKRKALLNTFKSTLSMSELTFEEVKSLLNTVRSMSKINELTIGKFRNICEIKEIHNLLLDAHNRMERESSKSSLINDLDVCLKINKQSKIRDYPSLNYRIMSYNYGRHYETIYAAEKAFNDILLNNKIDILDDILSSNKEGMEKSLEVMRQREIREIDTAINRKLTYELDIQDEEDTYDKQRVKIYESLGTDIRYFITTSYKYSENGKTSDMLAYCFLDKELDIVKSNRKQELTDIVHIDITGFGKYSKVKYDTENDIAYNNIADQLLEIVRIKEELYGYGFKIVDKSTDSVIKKHTTLIPIYTALSKTKGADTEGILKKIESLTLNDKKNLILNSIDSNNEQGYYLEGKINTSFFIGKEKDIRFISAYRIKDRRILAYGTLDRLGVADSPLSYIDFHRREGFILGAEEIKKIDTTAERLSEYSFKSSFIRHKADDSFFLQKEEIEKIVKEEKINQLDLLEEVEYLITNFEHKVKDGNSTYIVRSILSRGVNTSKLTIKQRRVVQSEIDRYKKELNID